MFLYKQGNEVMHFICEEDAKKFYGLDKPDMVISEEEFERAEGLLRVIDGNIVVGLTQQETIARDQETVRNKRNGLLESVVDKMQGVLRWNNLTPEKQQAWTKYRQDLLDITLQPAFNTEPLKVIFPDRPSV